MRQPLKRFLQISAFLSVFVFGAWLWMQQYSLSSERENSSPKIASLNLPLYFEPNQGQVDASVQFLSRDQKHSMFFSPEKMTLALSGDETPQNISLGFMGANTNPKITGIDPLIGKSHYFIGNDASKWKTNISQYAKVKYEELYPGIDLVVYGNNQHLEYDLVVSPHADPNLITFDIEGADLKLDDDGNLLMAIAEKTEIIHHRPKIYQELNGKQIPIEGTFVIKNNRVSFTVAQYDRTQTLVIDPVIEFATYLGGNDVDTGNAIAVDSQGYIYVTGNTWSNNFPTQNGYQLTKPTAGIYSRWPPPLDIFVTKISPDGRALIFSTYLGGQWVDTGDDIAVDNQGTIYITGRTYSDNFPTQNAYQARPNPAIGTPQGFHYFSDKGDAYITKLAPNGQSLVFSTYLGGSKRDEGQSIAVDTQGSVYVTGITDSADFPTRNAFQPQYGGEPYQGAYGDVFVTKFAPDGRSLVYSTYLGGNHQELSRSIAVDTLGSAYVAGWTLSSNFPATANAYQSQHHSPPNLSNWQADGFITKFSPDGRSLIYSTFLGGTSTDDPYAMTIDTQGAVYVTGKTASNDFPLQNPQQGTRNNYNSFLTKLSPSGQSLVFSTYTGSSRSKPIAIDSQNNIYIEDGKFSSNGRFLQSLLLNPWANDFTNDFAIDSQGILYLTGQTQGSLTVQNAFQATYGGGVFDAFVMKVRITCTDNASCSDDNACNGIETCNASGVCVVGIPLNIPDDNNVCTLDCDPATGNRYVPQVGATCPGDNDLCTGVDICTAAGECRGVIPNTQVNYQDGNDCTVDSCNPLTGAFTNISKADGTACLSNSRRSGICCASECKEGLTVCPAPVTPPLGKLPEGYRPPPPRPEIAPLPGPDSAGKPYQRCLDYLNDVFGRHLLNPCETYRCELDGRKITSIGLRPGGAACEDRATCRKGICLQGVCAAAPISGCTPQPRPSLIVPLPPPPAQPQPPTRACLVQLALLQSSAAPPTPCLTHYCYGNTVRTRQQPNGTQCSDRTRNISNGQCMNGTCQ